MKILRVRHDIDIHLKHLHSNASLRISVVCKQSGMRTFVQGNCTEPVQNTSRDPPLEPFKPGQCLLEAELAHFTFETKQSPASVWISNLYLRAFPRKQKVETLISFLPPSFTTLWITNVTTQGGRNGLLANTTTFVAGAPKLNTYRIFCMLLWSVSSSFALQPVHEVALTETSARCCH